MLTPEQAITVLRKELSKRRIRVTFYFAVISLSVLTIGYFWPKQYSSSSTILVDQQNILQPLMEGTAVTTGIIDRAKIAREIIFSRTNLEKIAEIAGNNSHTLTPLEKEKFMEEIRFRTRIASVGRDLIEIIYKDKNPITALKVTEGYVDLFIEQSVEAKKKESQGAYDFIDEQAKNYHAKLKEAEQNLKEFRASNLDARPGSESVVNARIVELRSRIEQTRMEIRETEIRSSTIKNQLSGEAEVTASIGREQQYQERLNTLQNQLDTLRLSYHDSYPDIVRLKNQIDDLKVLIIKEQNSRSSGIAVLSTPNNNPTVNKSQNLSNPLYQELRKELSKSDTTIATLKARLVETRSLLEEEQNRVLKIDDVKAKLAELTRDYEVNQDLYQQLLRQREKARVSMNIDKAQQGLTFKIQEPAALPLQPTGLRLLHFAVFGILLGITIPSGLLYIQIMLDKRIRVTHTITENLGLPVLAAVPHYRSIQELRLQALSHLLVPLIISGVIAAYGYVAWIRFLKVS